jgi:hypothetical protein
MYAFRLITLTSFPFRVVHMNEAFRKMTRRETDNSILGQAFCKLLAHEETERPRMATCHSPLGDFDEHVVRLLRSKAMTTRSKDTKDVDSPYLVCKIQVKPIFNLIAQQEPAAQCLLHYAIVLEEVKESPPLVSTPPECGEYFPVVDRISR